MTKCGDRVKETCESASRNKYALYVLVMLMLAYMINQCDTYCLIATNSAMAQEMEYGDRECSSLNDTAVYAFLASDNYTGGDVNQTADVYCNNNPDNCDSDLSWQGEVLCYWEYLGSGLEYQLLAGPLYVILFSISGIPMGLISELHNINRKLILSICVILWSVMTVFGGLCNEYWQVAITRLLLGTFAAGCVPFAASLIADYFSKESRGAAMGFFNWGVYVGYSLTFLLVIAERELGWNAVYYIAGAPGVLIGFLILFTVKEPPREETKESSASQMKGILAQLRRAFKHFTDPALFLLCLGGAIRNGAGIVFAYNIIIFFDEYHPGVNTEEWMSWIPLIFGSIGAFGGGFVSDKLAVKRGTVGRLMVLIGCLLFSAPLLIGTLYAPMPYCWVCHIFAYVIGEMWIGVCVAVVVDLVPPDLTTSSIAVYFFIIQIIGGNMPLLVPPIEQALGLQLALVITFPGMYVLAAIFFVFTLLIILRQKKKSRRRNSNEDAKIDKQSVHSGQGLDDPYIKSTDLLGDNDELSIGHQLQQSSSSEEHSIHENIRL